jgi:4-amino-4-deoxy-L-arabinose transferase-like glycosyltransferase
VDAIEPEPTRETPASRLREAITIGLLVLALNLAGNGRMSLWDRDEPRFTGAVREMRARGEWLRPTFNGEPRHHKPILIYWLMRAGMAVGGEGPWGARLVSAVAGMATCLLVWRLGRRVFGPTVGRLGALALATAPLMFVESKIATTDATLTLWLVGVQSCVWELGRRDSRAAAAGFWAFLALATMTKGPVGPAFVAVAGLLGWWWGAPTVAWKRLRWRRGLAGFVALTLPWYVAIGLATRGEFYRFALGLQGIGRVTEGIEEHGGFPGYYLVLGMITFFPWSSFLPAAVRAAWKQRKARPEFGYVLGWIVGPLVLLECVRTKLIHYYLPALPPCALLVAWLVEAVARDVKSLRRWPLGSVGIGLLVGFGFVATATLLAGVVVLPWPLRRPALAMAVVLVAGMLLALERIQDNRTLPAFQTLILTWTALGFLVALWFVPAFEPYRMAPKVSRQLAELSKNEGVEPILASLSQPSIIYDLGRRVTILRDRDDLNRHLRTTPAVVAALLPDELKPLLYDRRFRVEDRGTIQGINHDKAREFTVHLVLIRRETDPSRLARRREPLKIK